MGDLIPTRHSLLDRLKNWEDTASWQEFFDRYWRLIYSVAIKAGLTEVEAQEVVQETIIAVSKKMPAFKYDAALGSFKGWLLHLTRWRIKDQFRKRQSDAHFVARTAPQTSRTATIERIPDPATPDLEAVWNEEWKHNIVEVAIERVKRQVSLKQYQIFDLYALKRWPIQRVAETLGITVGQVYLAKHRVAALLKKEVKDLETQMI